MENELLGIGKMAALSGLSVSALRFYDGAGVLAPCWVDPSSGYRFYRRAQVGEARLVAHLRRVGLPLGDIRAVLAHPGEARPVLDAHLARLEAGLADARREISIVQRLIETTETPMHRCTLPAPALVGALRDVRHAVSTDPDQPRLHGVYLDSEDGGLRVVATDRFRLATSVVATAAQTGLHVLLPTSAVDELVAADPRGTLDVAVADGVVTFDGPGCSVRAEVPDVDFPSYRVLLERGRREVGVDAAALRAALAAEPAHALDGDAEVSLLTISEVGVHLGRTGDPDALVVALNRGFLLEALAAGDQLTLGFDEPITPLAVRSARPDGLESVLMPVRLDRPA